MDVREFDIILYGGNGYTAGYVIKELELTTLNVAIAARDISKIRATSLPTIQCTLDSITELTIRTKVLINCVGPYSLTGEQVIQGCIDTGTHYVDICGETFFIDKIFKKYHSLCKEKGITIAQSCGFDSLPADIGAYLIGKMHNVKEIDCCYVLDNCKINETTWKSLLLSLRNSSSKEHLYTCNTRGSKPQKNVDSGMGGANENLEKNNKMNTVYVKKRIGCTKENSIMEYKQDQNSIKDEVNNKHKYESNPSYTTSSNATLTTRSLPKRNTQDRRAKLKEYRYNKDLSSYDVKFRGTDPYIIKRSCDYFRSKLIYDVQFSCFLNIGSVFSLISYLFFGFICFVLSKYNFFYGLMIRFPSFFTFGHVVKTPTEEDTMKSTFTIIIKGKSVKNTGNKILTISGVDPGYRSTAIFVTQAAISIIEEQNNVSIGVTTPAVAFYKTKLVDRLISKGIKFEYKTL